MHQLAAGRQTESREGRSRRAGSREVARRRAAAAAGAGVRELAKLRPLAMRPSAAPMSAPAAHPNVMLLGVPKAGTMWLHECLTSTKFEPEACCRNNKEPVRSSTNRSTVACVDCVSCARRAYSPLDVAGDTHGRPIGRHGTSSTRDEHCWTSRACPRRTHEHHTSACS